MEEPLLTCTGKTVENSLDAGWWNTEPGPFFDQKISEITQITAMACLRDQTPYAVLGPDSGVILCSIQIRNNLPSSLTIDWFWKVDNIHTLESHRRGVPGPYKPVDGVGLNLATWSGTQSIRKGMARIQLSACSEMEQPRSQVHWLLIKR